jgi:hypothetical protein
MMDRIERIRQSFFTRKLEHSDTDDHIKRHDPDYHKNQSKGQPKNHEFLDNDLTDISVESLIIFLQGLKKEKDYRNNKQHNKPIDTSMSKAIKAYGQNTPNPEKRHTYLDDDQDIDLAKVDQLIDNLELIKETGIIHITLLQSDGFLQSIEKTLEKYRPQG